ncbi:hypothetical protein SLA2020_200570 [Shorea laevis]
MDNLCAVWMKLKGNTIDTGEATRAKFENKTQLRDFRVYLDGDLDEDEVIQAFNLPSSINVHFCNADFEYKWPVYRYGSFFYLKTYLVWLLCYFQRKYEG